MNIIFENVKDIVESNGKTICENNMEKQHSIPLGALVKLKIGECDFFAKVSKLTRDCDGEPLYSILITDNGYSEDQLEEIKINF